jgi:hypothetical protein
MRNLKDELLLDPVHYDLANRWLDRGDGIAVYENQTPGHPDAGHRQFLSYGSPVAQIETDAPPQQLPDIGSRVNMHYRLVGVYKGPPL